MGQSSVSESGRPFVFVTGPYSGSAQEEVERNIKKAIEVGRIVFERGYYPIVPHLLVKEYYNPRDDSETFGYEPLMQYTLAIVPKCDILLIYEHSPGADREWRLAENLGKTIYFDVDQLPRLVANNNA